MHSLPVIIIFIFIYVLRVLCLNCGFRGSFDEKTHFLFNMMDVMHDNKISKQELSTLLNQGRKHALITYFLTFGCVLTVFSTKISFARS